ncbi:MAG TPA: TadE/TadG family type IV pilus assembly protein [Acidimicrobiales bacterium]|nr:TadE/TadG family type IV pilus assembly protein [Acidimicrobiales bacterium]
MRRRHYGEQGTVLVEAALVLPIMFVILSAVVDFGFWDYQNTQVSNAARDGARVAMLDYQTTSPASYADSPGSFSSSDTLTTGSADQLIQAAIASHLVGRSFTATVACVSSSTNTTTPCQSATPGTDEISVTVTTNRPSYSFIGPRFGSPTITETSTVVIVGLPTTETSATTTSTTTTTSSTTTTTLPKVHVKSMSSTTTGTYSGGTKAWDTTITISVADASGNPISGALVTGSWDTAVSTSTTSCTTAAAGTCQVEDGVTHNLPISNVTFTVGNVAASGYTYDSSADNPANGALKVNHP